jgi:hypothetical protein
MPVTVGRSLHFRISRIEMTMNLGVTLSASERSQLSVRRNLRARFFIDPQHNQMIPAATSGIGAVRPKPLALRVDRTLAIAIRGFSRSAAR